ncbi:MAG TPA: diguanylate cyclase [Gemmatimonadaceae bacterium]|nr:diguanylate cyclase [Gemmatimonadaceae bacterium]
MSGDPIRIVAVCAPERSAELAAEIASDGRGVLELVAIGDVALALRALGDARVDAVLLDFATGQRADLEPLIRLHEHAPELPIIVLTDGEDDRLAMRVLKAGAQDALVRRDLSGGILVRAVRFAIERQHLQIALRAMSLVDDLTGLYNRRGFLTVARQQLKMADRMRKRMVHVFVDVDGLKEINDTHGHREGDRVLLQTAELLKETFRDSDIVARIGGDEFVVLAMETSGATAEAWSSRIREQLHARNARAERVVPVAFSMGIAYYDPECPVSIDELLAKADALMYAEKRRKRQRRVGYHDVPGDQPASIPPIAD